MSQAVTIESQTQHSENPQWDNAGRAQRLLETVVEFIPNADFESRFHDEVDSSPALDLGQPTVAAPSDLPAHLKRLCESELLTAEREALLFREMNYLKYQAGRLQFLLQVDRCDESLMEKIEGLLQQAAAIRDQIITANMRLVISIVKKFVTPQQSFDEMLSDGIVTLMQTVEKFDFDRGFRFSTYAYRSIARNAYRAVSAAQKEESRMTRDADEWAFEEQADGKASSMTEQVWSNLRELASALLQKLDRRERFIIRGRYALGAHRKVRTFQCLADKLGVSKERARQLEQRAVSKLRKMASEFEMDDLFAAAMV